MEAALQDFVERDVETGEDLAEAFADANEAAVNEWIDNDDICCREVDEQIIIDKDELVKMITIMNASLLGEN